VPAIALCITVASIAAAALLVGAELTGGGSESGGGGASTSAAGTVVAAALRQVLSSPRALPARTMAATPAAAGLVAAGQRQVQSMAAGAGLWRPPLRALFVVPAASGGSGGGGGSPKGVCGDNHGGCGTTGPLPLRPQVPALLTG